MPYCTIDDMSTLFEEDEIVEASNLRDARETDPNGGKIQAAIDGATGIIDGYLMRRYGLPVTTPPEIAGVLKIHALTIARYLLDGSTEEWRQKYDDTLAWLKLFSDPANGIGDPPGIQDGEGIGSADYEPGVRYWDAQKVGMLF